MVTAAVGCSSPYLGAGRLYLARGNLPMAVEVFDYGLAKDASDSELRDELILAEQTYQRELRSDIDRLTGAERYLLALHRLLLLEESARRASALQLPTEEPRDVEAEQRRLAPKAVAQLQRALDERAARGTTVQADLATCQQLAALSQDAEVARNCERLLAHLKHVLTATVADGSSRAAAGVLDDVAAEISRRKPELLEIVPAEAERENGVLRLYVGEPEVDESDFVLVQRDAYHTWVPKRGPRGQQLTEVVTVEPSAEEVARAERAGKPKPSPRKVTKKVWQQVHAEYRHYRAYREVRIPYRVVIEDLRSRTLIAVQSGIAELASESRYFEYEGPKEAQKPTPQGSAPGRARAARLPSRNELGQEILRALPARIVKELLERLG